MTTIDHVEWAQYLQAGVDEQRELQAITKQIDRLTIEDAYAIQAAGLDLLLEGGATLAGAKLGLTSAAKQEQMGVNEPVYGWVTEASVLREGGEVDLAGLIHPRVEPEIVFILGANLAGPGVTAEEVLYATTTVVGGIEVIDSRFEKFSFTLPDVIADNTSAARVAIGTDGINPLEMDLAELGCDFEVDGEITGSATGAALLGSPAECVAMLANHLGRYGHQLEAGWLIMAGACTDARPLSVGTVATARYSHVGPVTVRGV